MSTWKKANSDGFKEMMWTCSCGETMNQLDVFDWDDGIIIVSISDPQDSLFSKIKRFFRHRGNYQEIVLSPEDAASLAKKLNEYANKYAHEKTS